MFQSIHEGLRPESCIWHNFDSSCKVSHYWILFDRNIQPTVESFDLSHLEKTEDSVASLWTGAWASAHSEEQWRTASVFLLLLWVSSWSAEGLSLFCLVKMLPASTFNYLFTVFTTLPMTRAQQRVISPHSKSTFCFLIKQAIKLANQMCFHSWNKEKNCGVKQQEASRVRVQVSVRGLSFRAKQFQPVC